MINDRPSVILFKPKKRPDGRNVDDYLLKEGDPYFVLEIVPDADTADTYTVQNGAGMLVHISKTDAEIVR